MRTTPPASSPLLPIQDVALANSSIAEQNVENPLQPPSASSSLPSVHSLPGHNRNAREKFFPQFSRLPPEIQLEVAKKTPMSTFRSLAGTNKMWTAEFRKTVQSVIVRTQEELERAKEIFPNLNKVTLMGTIWSDEKVEELISSVRLDGIELKVYRLLHSVEFEREMMFLRRGVRAFNLSANLRPGDTLVYRGNQVKIKRSWRNFPQRVIDWMRSFTR